MYIECRSYDIKIKRKNELSKERQIVLNLSIFPRYNNRANQIALYYIITYTILKNKIKIHLVKITTSSMSNLLITPFIILVFLLFLFLTKLEYIWNSIKKMLPVKVKVLSFQCNEIVTFSELTFRLFPSQRSQTYVEPEMFLKASLPVSLLSYSVSLTMHCIYNQTRTLMYII